MFRIRRVLTILLILTLAGSMIPEPISAQDAPRCVPPSVGNRPDAPNWAQHGPHWVGFTEFTIETGERPIPVAMWYPALNPDCVEERITYEYDPATMPGMFDLVSMFPREGAAIRDAVSDLTEAPYPLVVYLGNMWSHKMAGLVLGEHLASQGYVVMSGTYEDSPGNLSATGYGRGLVSRALDITRMIDHAEVLNAEEAYANLIDTDLVAPIGFFTGDVAAAEAGGARLNTDFAEAWADQNDPGNGFVEGTLTARDALAGMLGVDIPTDGLWPSVTDERVHAVVLLAPTSVFLGEAGYRSLEVPTLILNRGLDGYPNDGIESDTDYNWIPAQDKALVVFAGAEVYIFNPQCVAFRGEYKTCSDPTWDMARVHDLIRHFVTAFLNYELRGDQRLCGALQPASVHIPSVRFESTIRCSH